MSFRKEKKFRLSQSDILLAKSTLIKSGMITLHPSRVITSQYFDTNVLECFRIRGRPASKKKDQGKVVQQRK